MNTIDHIGGTHVNQGALWRAKKVMPPKQASSIQWFGLRTCHYAALLSFLPFSVLYLPVYTNDTAGVMTARDITLFVVWCTTVTILVSKRSLSLREHHCIQLCALALLPAFLGILASVSYDSASPLMRDFFQLTKRFGGSSILTIAVFQCTDRQRTLLAKTAVIALFIMDLVPLTPIYNWFLLPQSVNGGIVHMGFIEDRNAGLLGNPNEFGVVAFLALAIALGGITGRSAWLWKLFASTLAIYAVVSSASRGAMAALMCAGLFLVVNARLSLVKQVAIALAFFILIWAGFEFSDTYKNRMTNALSGDTSDVNFVARLDAQEIAIITSVHYPLGVGLTNIAPATEQYSANSLFGLTSSVGTSDSIFLDYLLATGVGGLACIVLVFRLAWSLVSTKVSSKQCVYLQAGVIGIAVASLSMLSPASVFASPFFFVLLGLHPSRK